MTKSKILLGEYLEEPFYLERPSFDCEWYIGFNHIGNNNHSTHLDWFLDEIKPNTNMFDQMKEVFKDTLNENLKNDKKLWEFCDLTKSWITLKNAYELYHSGNSHYTSIKGLSLKSVKQSCKLIKDQIRVLNKLCKIIDLDQPIKFKEIENAIKRATKPTIFIIDKEASKGYRIIYHSRYDNKSLEDYEKEGYKI